MKGILFLLTVLLVLVQHRLWVGEDSLTELHHMTRAIEMQRQHNATLKARNTALAAEVHDLKHGLMAIESRARSELGMIARDETYFHLVR